MPLGVQRVLGQEGVVMVREEVSAGDERRRGKGRGRGGSFVPGDASQLFRRARVERVVVVRQVVVVRHVRQLVHIPAGKQSCAYENSVAARYLPFS